MKKLLLGFILFTLSFFSLKAQESSFWKPDRLSLSYFGSHFTHPGVKLEAEKIIWKKDYLREKKQRNKRHEWVAGPSLGFYSHWRYQKGLFLQAHTAYRHIGHRGFTKELRIGLGFLETFVPHTFEVGADGSLSRNRFATNTYFMPSLSLGLGKDIRDSDWGYHIRPVIFWYIPYFPSQTINVALEVGISRRIG